MEHGSPSYDVVIVGDGRRTGGPATSAAGAIVAQQRAGYASAFVHIDSRSAGQRRAFDPRLARLFEDGTCDLLTGAAEAHARLVVIHPADVLAGRRRLPALTAERALLVADHPPSDMAATESYSADEIADHTREWLGTVPVWAPDGPATRERISRAAPEVELLDEDWIDVLDVDVWNSSRDRARGSRPVIGRRASEDRREWPTTRDEIIAAFPVDGSVDVRILGGAGYAVRAIGGVPGSWSPYAGGAMPPQRFLASIDFFVAFPQPDCEAPIDRPVLEAMASGVIPILPHWLRGRFGDAPVHVDPAEVSGVVHTLHADRAAYLSRSRRAQAFVSEHFGPDAHLHRLSRWLGPPAAPSTRIGGRETGESPTGGRPPALPRSASDQRKVLFVSSNGVGVGHLMRLMSMARRADERIVPLFLSLSQAMPVVRQAGFYVEYLASRGFSRMSSPHWNRLLRDRVGELIRTHDVAGIVFDGTSPYRGLLEAGEDHPGVSLVWSRRALWRPGVATTGLDAADRFDHIIEPGDVAETADRGPTVARRHEAVRVGPITFLDRDELLDRAEARVALGLDPDRPAALIQLGAGNINDVSSVLGSVTSRLVAEDGLQVCVTRSILADTAQGLEAEVIPLAGIYPLARYYHAFDLAVTAAGYNSVHESLVAGLPTIFVPNLATSADDQATRAAYADEAGVALHLPDPTVEAIDQAITTMLDPARREEMSRRAIELMPPNGATEAMRTVERVVGLTADPHSDPRTQRSASDLSGSESARREDPLWEPFDHQDRAPARVNGEPVENQERSYPSPARPAVSGNARTASWAGVTGRYLRATSTVSMWAQSPQVRAVAGPPFNVLPRRVRSAVRRRLRRWEGGLRLLRAPQEVRIPVPAGRLLPASVVERGLSGLMFLLPYPITAEENARLVDRIGGLQIVHRGFAPLVATFCDDLTVFQGSRIQPEVLPTPESWARSHSPEPWEAQVLARLERLLDTYSLEGVYVMGSIKGIPDEELRALSRRRLPGDRER